MKPRTISRAPKASSTVVVMARAFPASSTTITWLVPCSGWGGMGESGTSFGSRQLGLPGLGWAMARPGATACARRVR